MDRISQGDADEWRESLLSQYSPATVGREVKRAKQYFRAAKTDYGKPVRGPGSTGPSEQREHFVATKDRKRWITDPSNRANGPVPIARGLLLDGQFGHDREQALLASNRRPLQRRDVNGTCCNNRDDAEYDAVTRWNWTQQNAKRKVNH